MDENQYRLNELLKDLAKNDVRIDDNNVDKYILELQGIYDADFRHLYSSLFGTITSIDENSSLNLMGLSANIQTIHDAVINDSKYKDADFYLKIKKLYDHINLDISRIEYTKKIADKINEENAITNKELRTVRAKADQMQKDYVTILGIFSSIVITFVAGMVFSGSVLNNIDKASIYRLTFVMIMIGFLIFNLLNLLLRAIQRINGQHILVNEKGNTAITSINVILFLFLLIDFVMWGIYWYRALHPNSWMSF